MKNFEDPRLLAHKRAVDTERRARAIDRNAQRTLRNRNAMSRIASATRSA